MSTDHNLEVWTENEGRLASALRGRVVRDLDHFETLFRETATEHEETHGWSPALPVMYEDGAGYVSFDSAWCLLVTTKEVTE